MQTKSQQILDYLQTIPKGKVSTYKLIGEKFGLHPRAIAQIMRYNKDYIRFPCYKVISHSGKISGYNSKRGIEEKIEKLQKDGIIIVKGKIDKSYFYI